MPMQIHMKGSNSFWLLTRLKAASMMLSQFMLLHLCMPLQDRHMYIEAHIDVVEHGCRKALSSRIQEWRGC